MRIDLHTHSTESDGTQVPADVVASARRAGLDVVALTDHDTTRGWSAARESAQQHGVGFVPGIEISCSADGISTHLLGYLVDPDNKPLLLELERARESRETRAQRMVQRLAPDTGLTWEQVQEQYAEQTTIGRPHLADALVAAGVVADRTEAFQRYLHNDSPYYVHHYAPDPVHAVELVTAAGGVAVLAHPFAASRGRIVADQVVQDLAEAGLFGIEVDHRDHTDEQRERAERLAARLGLRRFGSSDYHGTGKPNRLGENTTAPAVLDDLLAAGTGSPAWLP